MALTLPPDNVVDAIHGSVTRVTRRVEFYESDAVTPWEPEGKPPAITDGQVTIDQASEERRTFDVTIGNPDNLYRPGVNGLWYDKYIKLFRGVVLPDGSTWERQLGLFLIDNLSSPHFPERVKISGRDRSKLLKKSKFATHTMYPANHPIEEVVRDIAVSGGIDIADMDLPVTGESLNEDKVFDQGGERWGAIREVCTAYNYEVFFDGTGVLTMRPFQDPFTLPAEYTFRTGVDGNLATYDRQLTDARIRNHIVVIGENASQVPIFAEAKNEDPNSPTRIDKIGQRTETFDSAFIESLAQGEELAVSFLKVMGLEQYSLSIGSIVVPYLDVGVVVSFVDPDPDPADPTEYLLQNVTIPLVLSSMSASAGRVTNINAT